MHTACEPDGHVQKPDRQPIGMSGGIAEQAESGKNWSDLINQWKGPNRQGIAACCCPLACNV